MTITWAQVAECHKLAGHLIAVTLFDGRTYDLSAEDYVALVRGSEIAVREIRHR